MTKVDLDKLRSISVGSRTRNKVVEGRTGRDDHRFKATTDELGNTVTEHNTRDDRVDVNIRAPHTQVQGDETREVRQHG